MGAKTTTTTTTTFGGLLLALFLTVLTPTTILANTAAAAAASSGGIITKLTDDNFEHLTQASTGQTTGKWFVVMGAVWCGYACTKLHPLLEELPRVAPGVVVGMVDTTANRAIAERFQIVDHPTLLYFADRKMYRYGSRASGQDPHTLEAFREFCIGGYQQYQPLPIPAPPSFTEVHMKKLIQFLSNQPELIYLKEDFQHILEIRKNAAVVLVCLGVLVGWIAGCGCGCLLGKKKRYIQPKPKNE